MTRKPVVLTKKLCQRCVRESGHDWTPSDALEWDNGIVLCEALTDSSQRYRINTTQLPPKLCKYRLEHIVCWSASSDNEPR